MPFNIEEFNRLIRRERLKDCHVAFTYPIEAQGRAAAIPIPFAQGDQWEVEILGDEEYKIRDAFEIWLNFINRGDWTTATAQIIDKKGINTTSPPLIPVHISTIEMCWGCEDYDGRFTVRFLVDPLPFGSEHLPAVQNQNQPQ